ncbi:putative GAF sensor protein [Terriglobus saanensis SP1PR4]|uniref:Putative GAF sensor protein n=2 Tax=Terriglobus saanensis TaxID=870903 RepID=E8V2I6_TERSS|nr:putative GAF sensor protein [Terriglobus saanensis SP1PR4]
MKNQMDRSEILTEIREKAASASSLTVLQEQIVGVLANNLPHYSWTGFYMLDPEDPDTLVVGSYIGDPTPHVRIPVSQGICGAAVATGKTVVVDDVGSDPRYLSCSIETKSEIVVPIYASGRIIGEIDIDSHDPAAFTSADRDLLEEVGKIVGSFIENSLTDTDLRKS